MYNTTIYNSYKAEAERKNICSIDNLKYCKDGKTISFEVNYNNLEFVVTSSQLNGKQLGILVTLMGNHPIHFTDVVDVRAQSVNNLLFAMNEIIKEGK